MYNQNYNGGTGAQGAPPPTTQNTTGSVHVAPVAPAASTVPASDKKKPERISFPKKVRIMYDAMCRMGIAQANAIYSVAEFFKSLDMELAKARSDDKTPKPDILKLRFSDKQTRIINTFLNEGYGADKGADTDAILEHRQSRVAILVSAMCDILRKEHNVNLASMLAIIAVNPKYISDFAMALSKSA